MRFEQICGRTELFSEHYLAAPIGQILLGAGYRVTPEYKHPVLLRHAKGRGKRPAVDFVCRDSDDKPLKIAVESKWIGQSVPSFSKIFWDIIRLSLIAREEGADAYFLLGGVKRDISSLFAEKPFTAIATNKSKKFLLRRNEDVERQSVDQQVSNTVPLVPLVPDWQKTIRDLLADYPAMEVPNYITTQLSASFPHQSTASQYQIVVWRIGAKPNSGHFRLENSMS